MITMQRTVPQLYTDYWASWENFLRENGSPLPEPTMARDYWRNLDVGRPGVHLASVIKLETREPKDIVGLRVELCFRVSILGDEEATRLHRVLCNRAKEWEWSLGTQLDWESQAPPGPGKQRQVAVDIQCDPRDEADWPEQHQIMLDWLLRFLEHFDTTLRYRTASSPPARFWEKDFSAWSRTGQSRKGWRATVHRSRRY